MRALILFSFYETKFLSTFEERISPEAKFANALDRFEPLLQNARTSGFAWKKHGVTSDRVLAKNAKIKDGSEKLWEFAQQLVQDCIERGDLKK